MYIYAYIYRYIYRYSDIDIITFSIITITIITRILL